MIEYVTFMCSCIYSCTITGRFLPVRLSRALVTWIRYPVGRGRRARRFGHDALNRLDNLGQHTVVKVGGSADGL